MSVARHEFEQAGLGRAPFRVTGYSRSTPRIPCGHCGRKIHHVWRIASSDDQSAKVGEGCVKKVNDADLRSQMAVFRQEAQVALIAKAKDLLIRDDVRSTLTDSPSPVLRKNETALDWVEWMLKNSERTGQTKAALVIVGAARDLGLDT